MTPILLMEGNDTWQAVDCTTDAPIFTTIRNLITDKLKQLEIEKFKLEAPSFSKRLFDPLVSFDYTVCLLRSPNPKYSLLGDFVHRLINKSLPTKSRLRNYPDKLASNNNLPPHKKNKLLIAYSDSYCDYCCTKGLLILEDTAHIFSHCPMHSEIVSKTIKDLSSFITKQNKNSPLDIPIWFTSTCEVSLITDENEADLAIFPKELGDLGYIPKALHKWCDPTSPRTITKSAKRSSPLHKKVPN